MIHAAPEIAVCVGLVSLLLGLRNFIFSGEMKPRTYRVWIMTHADDDGGDDSAPFDEWPSEISGPADFSIQGKAALEMTPSQLTQGSTICF